MTPPSDPRTQDEARAREVLEQHGLEVTQHACFLYRANVAIGPALLAAMLQFAAEARAPYGWVLVPREPTEAMVRAWAAAAPDNWRDLSLADDADSNRAWATADWRAMIEADEWDREHEL